MITWGGGQTLRPRLWEAAQDSWLEVLQPSEMGSGRGWGVSKASWRGEGTRPAAGLLVEFPLILQVLAQKGLF